MAARLNIQSPHSAPRAQTETPSLFKRFVRSIRDVMVTPQGVSKEQVSRRDSFQMGTPTFQASAKRIISNANGNGFDGRKVDQNARSVRDQALVSWLNNEILKS